MKDEQDEMIEEHVGERERDGSHRGRALP